MSLCINCMSNVGGNCTWEQISFPTTFRCKHHITRPSKPLILVADNSTKSEPPVVVPPPTEFEAFSKTEPAKCLFYAKLP